MRADRDPSWVQELAARRGYALTDRSTAQHLQYRLEGTLGPSGQNRPWTCTANRYFLDDGGTEDWVDWACPSLQARSPYRELILLFGSGHGAGGGAGDLSVDAALLGVAAAVSLVRSLRRPVPQPVTDVLTVTQVTDPDGLFAGRVRELFCHWPVLERPAPSWHGPVRRFLRVTELPTDAPPDPLHVTMTASTPLSSSTRDWWQLGPRLEHQIDLGVALGQAVVAAGSHA